MRSLGAIQPVGVDLGAIQTAYSEVTPATPSGLSAVIDGADIDVTWNEADGVDGYQLQRDIEGSGYNTLSSTITGLTYTDLDVSSNGYGTYTYRVRSYIGSTYSDWSSTFEIELEAPYVPGDTPGDFGGGQDNGVSIIINSALDLSI